jgi:hypothetical protein
LSRLEYYSDYFSFTGQDRQGFVAFAMDNNRGRDGESYQAEHFLKFYDARWGWVSIRGDGAYANTAGQLAGIPDSEHFSFSGAPASGIHIRSAANDLELTVSPLSPALERRSEDGRYWMAAAPATLHWQGRVIEGRVIYEYLQRSNYNRLVRKSASAFRNFNGFYLLTDTGADFYFHSREGGGAELTGEKIGFATWRGPQEISEVVFDITAHRLAPGFYLWPTAWSGRFEYQGETYTFSLATLTRDTVKTWLIGGFAMAVVKGEIVSLDGEKRFEVSGFAELIM